MIERGSGKEKLTELIYSIPDEFFAVDRLITCIVLGLNDPGADPYDVIHYLKIAGIVDCLTNSKQESRYRISSPRIFH